jgi:hypothetical protein
VDFQLTPEQQRVQNKCRELAADFATRSATHDRDASHPIENYNRLREEGFLALSVGKEWGGSGASFLDHTIAYEALGQGCPSTALAFNMHASVIMPLLESAEVAPETKRRISDLVVHERKLIAGNFSEPVTTSLIGARPLKARARRADGGYRVTGHKMFASMLEAADFVLVMAYPDSSTSPFAGIIGSPSNSAGSGRSAVRFARGQTGRLPRGPLTACGMETCFVAADKPMTACGTKPRCESSIGRSAVEGEAAVLRTHHPFALMTQRGHRSWLQEAL